MNEQALKELAGLLDTGDLTCELSDHGVGKALVSQWPLQLGSEAFLGVARTVDAGQGDVPSVRATAALLERGEVLVVGANAARGAVLGGNLANTVVERGAAGVIVDGWLRDVPQLCQLGLTARARGGVPNRGLADGSGAVGAPVEIDGVEVTSGDVVVVDGSGVVIVPAARASDLERFLEQARTASRSEEY